MNPFSGKPFYHHSNDQKLYKVDKKFRGFGLYEDYNDCMVITSDRDDNTFSGNIFTNASHNPIYLKYTFVKEEIRKEYLKDEIGLFDD